MSEGIRSGVNWIRLNRSSIASARRATISVLASPGTPCTMQCPPASMQQTTESITSSCPTITWCTCRLSLAQPSCSLAIS